jgi:hypothetical protein
VNAAALASTTAERHMIERQSLMSHSQQGGSSFARSAELFARARVSRPLTIPNMAGRTPRLRTDFFLPSGYRVAPRRPNYSG